MSRILATHDVAAGLGVAVGLPCSDAMVGRWRYARRAGGPPPASSATVAPLRMALFLPAQRRAYATTGRRTKRRARIRPAADAEPLEAVQNDVTVLSGLALDNARAKGDGPGDHARSAAAFLTGPTRTRPPAATSSSACRWTSWRPKDRSSNAPAVAGAGPGPAQLAGNCDSGYACAYVSNISWSRDDAGAQGSEPGGGVRPAVRRRRTSGTPAETGQKRLRHRKSILDFVADDAKRLGPQPGQGRPAQAGRVHHVGSRDREAHRARPRAAGEGDGIGQGPGREAAGRHPRRHPRALPADGGHAGAGVPDGPDAGQHVHGRPATAATGTTARSASPRATTRCRTTAGSKRQDRRRSARSTSSTSSSSPTSWRGCRRSRRGSGTLLDNCMVMFGCGIGDGNRHNHNDLPILLAGKGGGMIKPGRHPSAKHAAVQPVRVDAGAMGVKVDRFGDSTGKLCLMLMPQP